MVSIEFEKFTLDNGLDVILSEDHSLPVTAVNIWYHVGSKNEEPGRTGFAHLFVQPRDKLATIGDTRQLVGLGQLERVFRLTFRGSPRGFELVYRLRLFRYVHDGAGP